VLVGDRVGVWTSLPQLSVHICFPEVIIHLKHVLFLSDIDPSTPFYSDKKIYLRVGIETK